MGMIQPGGKCDGVGRIKSEEEEVAQFFCSPRISFATMLGCAGRAV